MTVPIPKEHGAYVVLITSWLVGLLHAPARDPLPLIFSLLLLLSLFIVQEPARKMIRSSRRDGAWKHLAWIVLLSVVSTVSSAALIVMRPEIWKVMAVGAIVALVFVELVRRRAALLTLSSAGFFALSLGAPLARIAAESGAANGELIGLWLLTLLFFAGSSDCVRIRMARKGGAVVRALLTHLVLLATVCTMVAMGILPATAIVAVLPAIVRLAWILRDLSAYRAFSLKLIGLMETAVALLFIVINAAG